MPPKGRRSKALVKKAKFCRDQYTKVYPQRQSFVETSTPRFILRVTPEIIVEVLGIPLVQAPFVSDLEITSKLLDRVSIDLWGEVRDEMIVRGDPIVSTNEVLPYGILITQICQRAGVVFPVNSSFLEPMGPIDTSSWN
ncbi:hypothetical protein CK203_025293 [Vitis vinifera]|uniref:Uncharacterized protein n=1 Tax=Vitis vinifera TaxID=29760 RepID=A0A438IZR1_VITVI|nr:hypothetical protein CK203_025293 [Vitis vinifera]